LRSSEIIISLASKGVTLEHEQPQQKWRRQLALWSTPGFQHTQADLSHGVCSDSAAQAIRVTQLSIPALHRSFLYVSSQKVDILKRNGNNSLLKKKKYFFKN